MRRMQVKGECTPGLGKLRAMFEENFQRHGEVGAAVAVCIDGQLVADLWGGVARRAEGRPWERDTRVCMLSVSKGMASLCVHLLAQDGRIDLDAPVARYWPEFGSAGKERITVTQVLAHQSGVLTLDALKYGQLFDAELAAAAVAAQAPAWPPEEKRGAYHSSTYGVIAAELVRRVSGEPLEDFFERRVNGPLGTDFHFRSRDEELERTAHLIERPFNFLRAMLFEEPYFLRMAAQWKAMPLLGRLGFNSPVFLKSGFPSGAGTGTARSVARIYGELARSSEDALLLRPAAVERVSRSEWAGQCWTTGKQMRLSPGFMMNTPGGAYFGPGERTFGQAGRGGSFGFADPERRIGFSYCTNRLSETSYPDERSQRLVAALYDAVGRA